MQNMCTSEVRQIRTLTTKAKPSYNEVVWIRLRNLFLQN